MRTYSNTINSCLVIEGKVYAPKVTYIMSHIRNSGFKDVPKSWKDIGSFTRPHGTYESGVVTVYKAKDGTYRFSTYADGAFFPYIGNIEFHNLIFNDTVENIRRKREIRRERKNQTNGKT